MASGRAAGLAGLSLICATTTLTNTGVSTPAMTAPTNFPKPSRVLANMVPS